MMIGEGGGSKMSEKQYTTLSCLVPDLSIAISISFSFSPFLFRNASLLLKLVCLTFGF